MNLNYDKAEVVIAGGGVAGTIAAIAAAREGADTLLVERYGFLGGMFTGGNMTILVAPPIGGIGKEIVDQLMKRGYARYCPHDPRNYPIFHSRAEHSVYKIAYDDEIAKHILDGMALEAGVRIQLHTFVTGAVTEGKNVKGIAAVSKSGPQIIEGGIIIDATSDGDVAASANAPYMKGHPSDPNGTLFAMTTLVRLSNVNWKKISDYSGTDPGLKNVIAEARNKGELPYYKPRTVDMVNYWGHERPELEHWVTEDGAILWGGTVVGVDGTKVEDLTRAEMEARKQYLSEIDFLRKHVPGFENARIEKSGCQIGVRDTRHIIGEYTLTGKDILEGRTFPDTVAYGVHPTTMAHIPYRCLVPKTIDNLLLSGNCISTIPGSTGSGTLLGSYNNLKDIPTMWTTGEAAGTAAALCVKTHTTPRNLDVAILQERLKARGALVEPEVWKTYLERRVPSGITMAEYLERSRKNQIERWKRTGQL